jgi:hypothetical protein
MSDLNRHTSPKVDPAKRNEAADAVRHIGTNAIPYLLEWRLGKRPAWTEGMKLWESAWMTGFVILGPMAKQVIPMFTEIAHGHDTNLDYWNAIVALGKLGPDACPRCWSC